MTTHADPAGAIEPSTAATTATGGKIICNACPVLCNISEGRLGACDRYGNSNGVLTRIDPLVLLKKPIQSGSSGMPAEDVEQTSLFVTGIGATTTYPDYKPAPFIVSSKVAGVDTVTVVTEGIFSYCSFKVKIDTDRYLGPEQASVRCEGEVVGHVTTAEYGSQMLSLGGVHHLTGGSKKEGRIACETMLKLGNKAAVSLEIEGGSRVIVQAGKPPIINGVTERRMRVGCGSATIGIFAPQWREHVDEVIVVDDHITGVLTEHQAGRYLDMRPAGIRIIGKKSTPGRYFQVAQPGMGWGGTDITDPLTIVERIDEKKAWSGMRVLFVSTTGEDFAYFVLSETLELLPAPMPDAVTKVVERIGENCEPALCTVLFLGGAGGSLRAGVTENPILLTRSIKDRLTKVTCGGAESFVWPGGGIMVMADVSQMPDNSFGTVPTPAIVAPIEFSLTLADYLALGGYAEQVRTLDDVVANAKHVIL